MSRELLNAFFERDLSEQELEALQAGLSEEDALLFAEKARAFQRQLGVDRPWAATLRSWAGELFPERGLLAVLSLALALLGAAFFYRSWGRPQAQAVAAVDLPSARDAIQAGQKPAPYPRQLVLHLDLEEDAQVETLVKDSQGSLVGSLGSLAVKAGTHRLVWNGRLPDGKSLAPGRYQVLTRWKGQERVRWVELGASSV